MKGKGKFDLYAHNLLSSSWSERKKGFDPKSLPFSL